MSSATRLAVVPVTRAVPRDPTSLPSLKALPSRHHHQRRAPTPRSTPPPTLFPNHILLVARAFRLPTPLYTLDLEKREEGDVARAGAFRILL